MNLKNKIFYWSPFLVPIATPKAVVNSAIAMQKFGKDYDCSIINFFGEFNSFKSDLDNNNVKLIHYFGRHLLAFFPKYGKLKSRLSFMVIFILSFFPLKKLILTKKPDFLIIHLITSLPLILLILFRFKTKFILRISGLPKLNLFRKFLWKLALKKIYMVTCPTISTAEYIKSLNLLPEEKIRVLFDPIINIKKTNLKKREIINLPFSKDKYFFAAGRLTKQKNFIFLCNVVKNMIISEPNFKLVIAGDGEDKNEILSFIKKYHLEKNIFLIGYVDNIFPYILSSEAFILSSLWEDPGFVLVEAGYCRVPVISSNCPQGPKEIIKDGVNGILFNSNDVKDFLKCFKKLKDIIYNKEKKNKLILNNLLMTKKFSTFSHFLSLKKILKN